MNIKLKNYSSSAECKYELYTCRDAFPQFSGEFSGGNIYGIVSDYCCGSWGLVTCIGGRGNSDYDGQVYYNDIIISPDVLKQKSCFVTERIDDHLIVSEILKYEMEQNHVHETIEEIKRIFMLTDERFTRRMDCVSGEIWQISLAIGYASRKEIFCFPWLNGRNISKCESLLPILKYLCFKSKIILIPSNHKRILKKYCNKVYELLC